MNSGINIVTVVSSEALKRQIFKNNLKTKTLIIMAAINLLLGVLSIILHAVAMTNRAASSTDYAGWGIWIGSIYGITGLLGLYGVIKTDKCSIVASLVMSVFCLIFSTVGMALAGIGSCMYCNYYGWDTETESYFALERTLFAINIAEFIVNLVVLIVSSIAICSCCVCHKSPVYAQPIVTTLQAAQYCFYPPNQQQHMLVYTVNDQNMSAELLNNSPPSYNDVMSNVTEIEKGSL